MEEEKSQFPEAASLSLPEYATIKLAFQDYDKDGNGTISANELTDALRTANQNPTKKYVESLFEKYDMNMDGKISFPEFLKMAMEGLGDPAEDDAHLAEALQAFDTSGDGFLQADELRELLTKFGDSPLTEEELEDLFATFDENQDGRISIAEFIKATSTVVVTDEGAKLAPGDMFSASRRKARRKARRAFVLFDIDRSGYIETGEFQKLAHAMGEAMTAEVVEACMKEIDTSQDGKISFGEFLSWWMRDDRTKQETPTSAVGKKDLAVLKGKLHAANFVTQGKELLSKLSAAKMSEEPDSFETDLKLEIGAGIEEGAAIVKMAATFAADGERATKIREAVAADDDTNVVTAVLTLKDGADKEGMEEWCATMAKLLHEPLQGMVPVDEVPEPTLKVEDGEDGVAIVRVSLAMPPSEDDPLGILAGVLAVLDIQGASVEAVINHVPGGGEAPFGGTIHVKGGIGQLMGVAQAAASLPMMQGFDSDSDGPEYESELDPYANPSPIGPEQLAKMAEVPKGFNLRGALKIEDIGVLSSSLVSGGKRAKAFNEGFLASQNRWAFVREQFLPYFARLFKDEDRSPPQEIKDLYFQAGDNLKALDSVAVALGDVVFDVKFTNFNIFDLLFSPDDVHNAPPPEETGSDSESEEEEEAARKSKKKRSKVEKVFGLFDVDGSGSIDKKELRLAAYALGTPLTRAEAQAVLDSLDTSNDGVVTLDEFAAWYISADDKDEDDKPKLGKAKMRAMKAKLRSLNLKRQVARLTASLDEAHKQLAAEDGTPEPYTVDVAVDMGGYAAAVDADTPVLGAYVEIQDVPSAQAKGVANVDTIEGMSVVVRLAVKEGADMVRLAGVQELVEKAAARVYYSLLEREDECPFDEDLVEVDTDDDDRPDDLAGKTPKVALVSLEDGKQALEIIASMPATEDATRLASVLAACGVSFSAGLELNCVPGAESPEKLAGNAYLKGAVSQALFKTIQAKAAFVADELFMGSYGSKRERRERLVQGLASLPLAGQVDLKVKLGEPSPLIPLATAAADTKFKDDVASALDPGTMFATITKRAARMMARAMDDDLPDAHKDLYFGMTETLASVDSVRWQIEGFLIDFSFKNANLAIFPNKEQVDKERANLDQGEDEDDNGGGGEEDDNGVVDNEDAEGGGSAVLEGSASSG